eukprot:211598-Rhodomonas_salina.3
MGVRQASRRNPTSPGCEGSLLHVVDMISVFSDQEEGAESFAHRCSGQVGAQTATTGCWWAGTFTRSLLASPP